MHQERSGKTKDQGQLQTTVELWRRTRMGKNIFQHDFDAYADKEQ
jgi:hypothetical protein